MIARELLTDIVDKWLDSLTVAERSQAAERIMTPREKDALRDARESVWYYITVENAPILAAVLAEVARLEPSQPPRELTADDWKALHLVLTLADQVALYGKSALDTFIEAMRLGKEGA